MRALAIVMAAMLAGGIVVGVRAHAQPKAAPDTDGDGIPDSRDKCPTDPEDKDGFQDADGCPDPDNDGDGIPDAQDKCPNDPEDKDGFEDLDGCPDPDNDQDGVPDTRDKCPDQQETRNGYQDEDGCPDVAPAAAAATGTLFINALPACDVSVDGKAAGRTPLTLAVAVGPHRVQLTNPSRGIDETETIKVGAGQTSNLVKNFEHKADQTHTPPPTTTPPPPTAKPKVTPPTGYRCGPGGKFQRGEPCTCASGRFERRDADGVSVCAKNR